MNTYTPKVIAKSECLSCGAITTDPYTLEVFNDLDPTCPECGVHERLWTLEGGETVRTDEGEVCFMCGGPNDGGDEPGHGFMDNGARVPLCSVSCTEAFYAASES